MQFLPPLKPARLIKRYKRFLADAVTADGEEFTLHCANTGAMTGCATPGDTVWYSTSDSKARKYPHTWEVTETQTGAFICVNTLRANQLVKEAIESEVIPELKGKLKGHAQRVPVKTGSVTELVSILGKKVTEDEVNTALKKATHDNDSFGYTDEEIVSSDVIGSHFGSVFDATQTEITEVGDLQLVKTVSWYDNEYGFVTQLIRVLEKFVKL